MENLSSFWDKLLFTLQSIFASTIFETHILPTKPISFYNQILTISVSSLNKLHWEQYIKQSVESILKTDYPNIQLIIQLQIDEDYHSNINIPQKQTFSNQVNLKSSYTFDNFIVGEGNKMAHAAALAVSDSPGNFYNPLFIYGGSGLGKTHLMHAIGNAVLKTNPSALVRYVTSEDFVNEFTTAIRHGAMEQFKNNYRQVDVLLVDDVQFLTNKKETLNEFFNTFNVLREEAKQIVLTSDRLASEIPELPARLVSRFSSGLSTDITPPDLETRTAILRKKAMSNQINIPDDTLNYIAGHVNSNVRELEAALNRVNFYSITNRKEITTSLAAEALKSILSSDNEKVVTIYDIQSEVGHLFNLTVEELKGKKRTKDIVIPRQIAMFLARELTPHSLPKIGDEFGKKDHTTIMHACNKIDNIIKENIEKDLIHHIQFLKKKLQ